MKQHSSQSGDASKASTRKPDLDQPLKREITSATGHCCSCLSPCLRSGISPLYIIPGGGSPLF